MIEIVVERYNKPAQWLMCLIIVMLCACSKTPVEQQLTDNTQSLVSSIESMDVGGVTQWLHPDFQTKDGKDREWVKQVMTVYRLRKQSVKVTLANLSVQLDPEFADQASVTVHAALTSSAHDRFLPEQGQVYQVRMEWRESGGDWSIISAEWSKLL